MRTGAIRRMATAALWGLTIVLLVTLAARFKRNGDVRSYLPAVGDPVPLDTIGRLFRLDAEALEAPHARWLLVLSSSCPACLALDDELTQMQRAATCEGADLVPLIVEWGAPPDSMATVLRTHGLEPRGLSGPDGFLALRVRAVPTILSIDGAGTVSDIFAPGLREWPPSPRC